jgi:hypothetical protein
MGARAASSIASAVLPDAVGPTKHHTTVGHPESDSEVKSAPHRHPWRNRRSAKSPVERRPPLRRVQKGRPPARFHALECLTRATRLACRRAPLELLQALLHRPTPLLGEALQAVAGQRPALRRAPPCGRPPRHAPLHRRGQDLVRVGEATEATHPVPIRGRSSSVHNDAHDLPFRDG